MKLASDSNIIKWAYLMVDEWEVPDRTNVCALFWRVFFLSPLKLLTVGFMFCFLWPIPLCEWLEKKGYTDFLRKPIRIPLPTVGDAGKLAWQRVRDWKSGICTIVEID